MRTSVVRLQPRRPTPLTYTLWGHQWSAYINVHHTHTPYEDISDALISRYTTHIRPMRTSVMRLYQGTPHTYVLWGHQWCAYSHVGLHRSHTPYEDIGGTLIATFTTHIRPMRTSVMRLCQRTPHTYALWGHQWCAYSHVHHTHTPYEDISDALIASYTTHIRPMWTSVAHLYQGTSLTYALWGHQWCAYIKVHHSHRPYEDIGGTLIATYTMHIHPMWTSVAHLYQGTPDHIRPMRTSVYAYSHVHHSHTPYEDISGALISTYTTHIRPMRISVVHLYPRTPPTYALWGYRWCTYINVHHPHTPYEDISGAPISTYTTHIRPMRTSVVHLYQRTPHTYALWGYRWCTYINVHHPHMPYEDIGGALISTYTTHIRPMRTSVVHLYQRTPHTYALWGYRWCTYINVHHPHTPYEDISGALISTYTTHICPMRISVVHLYQRTPHTYALWGHQWCTYINVHHTHTLYEDISGALIATYTTHIRHMTTW